MTSEHRPYRDRFVPRLHVKPIVNETVESAWPRRLRFGAGAIGAGPLAHTGARIGPSARNGGECARRGPERVRAPLRRRGQRKMQICTTRTGSPVADLAFLCVKIAAILDPRALPGVCFAHPIGS